VSSTIDERDLLDRLVRRYPPRRYRLDQYKRWFPTTADAMARQLRRFPTPLPTPRPDTRPIGFVVVPWVSTPVPWYSIMLAIGLRRLGRPVVLVWDDTEFAEPRIREQSDAIARVLPAVEDRLPVVRLSALAPAAPRPGDDALLTTATELNVAWRLRGGQPTERDEPTVERIRQALTGALPLVRAAYAANDLEALVVPGGVYGTSGLFLEAGAGAGVRVATYDVDLDTAQLCVGGIASQSRDVPRAFATIWDGPADERAAAVATAREEFRLRTESVDAYGFQMVPAAGRTYENIAALVPLNVEWDSSALGRHVPFSDTTDWITSTVAAVLAADDGVVVVRQHPSERRPLQRSRYDVGAALRDAFPGDPRVRFVAADDPTSTYDLLRSARVVLPFVSTIGIEAAALGKPVILAGECYYAHLDLAWAPRTSEEYLDLVRRALRGELPLLDDQVERAWVCFYLTAVRNRVRTDFTAHPDAFWGWCRRSPESLFALPEVGDMLEAIDTDVPVSMLRHRRAVALG
jgi:hypothetical protein